MSKKAENCNTTISHKLIKDWYSEINRFRMIHGVQPLVYEDKLEQSAYEISQTMARLRNLELNEPRTRHYGEIAGKLLNAINNITGNQLAATWYATGDQYEYSLEEHVNETKAFTQLIWASSTEIGLGITIDSNGDAYFVGHFMPKGNIPGKFMLNVFPCLRKFQNLNKTSHEMNRIAIERVNYYRLKHSSPNLFTTLDLMKSAEDRAKWLVYHSHSVFDLPAPCNVGETSYVIHSPNEPLKFESIIDIWYNGGESYDFIHKSKDKETGAFTQMIWKSSKEVGFGQAFYDGYYVFVAHFFPPGNIEFEYHKNVLQSKQPQNRRSQASIDSINSRNYVRLLS